MSLATVTASYKPIYPPLLIISRRISTAFFDALSTLRIIYPIALTDFLIKSLSISFEYSLSSFKTNSAVFSSETITSISIFSNLTYTGSLNLQKKFLTWFSKIVGCF